MSIYQLIDPLSILKIEVKNEYKYFLYYMFPLNWFDLRYTTVILLGNEQR